MVFSHSGESVSVFQGMFEVIGNEKTTSVSSEASHAADVCRGAPVPSDRMQHFPERG